MYGTQRKVGVGFNAPLVLDGRMRHDWRKRYDFMRRLTRLPARRPWRIALPASLVEALRQYAR